MQSTETSAGASGRQEPLANTLGLEKDEWEINLPEAEWRSHTAAGMMEKHVEAERLIQDAVWLHINSLPEAQRDELLTAAANGSVHTHPTFIKTFEHVHAQLKNLNATTNAKPKPSVAGPNTLNQSAQSKMSSQLVNSAASQPGVHHNGNGASMTDN